MKCLNVHIPQSNDMSTMETSIYLWYGSDTSLIAMSAERLQIHTNELFWLLTVTYESFVDTYLEQSSITNMSPL